MPVVRGGGRLGEGEGEGEGSGRSRDDGRARARQGSKGIERQRVHVARQESGRFLSALNWRSFPFPLP